MFKGNNFRGSRLKGAEFNAKHPRGYGGRFAETPDKPKPAKKKLGKARVPQAGSGVRKIALGNTTREQKLALLQKFLEAEALADKKARQEKTQKLLKARVVQAESGTRRLVGGKPTIAKPEPKPEPTPEPAKKTKKKTKLTSEEAIAAKEAEKKAKAEAKIPEPDIKALKRLKDKLDSLSAVDDLDYVPRYGLSADTGLPKLPRQPQPRPTIAKSNLEICDDGIEIWKSQPEYGRFTGGWKVRDIKGYQYTEIVDGKEVVFNRNTLSAKFEGENVYGIPSMHKRLRAMSDADIVKRLVESMSSVEHAKSIKPESPEWVKTYMGEIDSDKVGYNKKVGEYGKSEIHHHLQWTRRDFREITSKLTWNTEKKEYEDGEITIEEARRQMRELLVEGEGRDKGKLVIKIIDRPEDRSLVIEPAGGHNFTSKLYDYLHPAGITLTGKCKPQEYGIPKDGEWGRETWFNAWNARFWTEYYRRESYVMRQEINRRMKKGTLTKDQVSQNLEKSKAKMERDRQFLESQAANHKAIHKAIIKDYLSKKV